jgi:predicted lipoprotein with Yx(FWY)xxD motif
MAHYLTTSVMLAAVAVLPTLAFAQDTAAVKVAESKEYGKYLTDGTGRALYLFEGDTKGDGQSKPEVSCKSDCLDRWPPFYVESGPQAGDMADASKLSTVEHDGKMMVTYNGWPLYYFVDDAAAGDTKGHDIEEFGSEWYLLTPEGEKAKD